MWSSPLENHSIVAIGLPISIAVLDLGQVSMDSKTDRRVTAVNKTNHEITIDRFQASCECTEVVGLPVTIAPGKTVELLLQNDLGKEPGFVGSLAIMDDLFVNDQICGKLELRVTATKELSPKSLENTVPIQPHTDSHEESSLAPPR